MTFTREIFLQKVSLQMRERFPNTAVIFDIEI